MPRKKVLFLCVGNACRSQIAEALARHLASDVIEPTSAGLYPFGSIPESTRAVLAQSGVSCDGQASKPLRLADLLAADLVINMTGSPSQVLWDNETLPVEDWDVEDPFGFDLEIYRRIREDVQRRVLDLAARLRAAGTSSEEAQCPATPPADRAKTT